MVEAKAGRQEEVSKGPELSPDVVEYINERARNIENYSDRLRKMVERVSDYFRQIREQSGVVYVSDHVVSLDPDEPDPTIAPNLLAVTGYGLSLLYPLPNAKGLVVEYGGTDYKYGKKHCSKFSRRSSWRQSGFYPSSSRAMLRSWIGMAGGLRGCRESGENCCDLL